MSRDDLMTVIEMMNEKKFHRGRTINLGKHHLLAIVYEATMWPPAHLLAHKEKALQWQKMVQEHMERGLPLAKTTIEDIWTKFKDRWGEIVEAFGHDAISGVCFLNRSA